MNETTTLQDADEKSEGGRYDDEENVDSDSQFSAADNSYMKQQKFDHSEDNAIEPSTAKFSLNGNGNKTVGKKWKESQNLVKKKQSLQKINTMRPTIINKSKCDSDAKSGIDSQISKSASKKNTNQLAFLVKENERQPVNFRRHQRNPRVRQSAKLPTMNDLYNLQSRQGSDE